MRLDHLNFFMCNFTKNKHVLVSFKLARKANPANNFTRCENVVYAKKSNSGFGFVEDPLGVMVG